MKLGHFQDPKKYKSDTHAGYHKDEDIARQISESSQIIDAESAAFEEEEISN